MQTLDDSLNLLQGVTQIIFFLGHYQVFVMLQIDLEKRVGFIKSIFKKC